MDLSDASTSDPLRQVVRHAPDIPFVVLTRRESAEVRAESLRWGAQDALAK